MKNSIVFIFAVFTFTSFAQTDQKEIDQQVWIPFTQAIMAHDVANFVKVHSNDLVRAERGRKKVMNLQEYKSEMEKGWPQWKAGLEKNNTKYVFELRFTERISNGSLAYEVGYFKNEMTSASGKMQIHYGKFQVALRKEAGTWKILVDSDTSEGAAVTDKEFLAAAPITP